MKRSHFDYGSEVTNDNNYHPWPEEGKRVAGIDGDMLPYIVGYTKTERDWFKAKLRVSSGECKTIAETPECINAFDHLDSLLNRWVMGAKCDAALVFLTNSAKNFRLKVAFSHIYKGERPPDKPPFFYEMRKYLMDMHGAILSDGNEADDLMSLEAMRRYNLLREEHGVGLGSAEHRIFCDFVRVTEDKDDAITPGWHKNPNHDEPIWVDELGKLMPKYKRNKEPTADYEHHLVGHITRGPNKGKPKYKRVKVGESIKEVMSDLKGTGLKFFYAQILLGDSADNYKGLPGTGPRAAFEIIDPCKSERELYYAVLKAYQDYYSNGTNEPVVVTNYKGQRGLLTPYQLMLEQGRLAWMQRTPGEIWRSKHFCPDIEWEGWNA